MKIYREKYFHKSKIDNLEDKIDRIFKFYYNEAKDIVEKSKVDSTQENMENYTNPSKQDIFVSPVDNHDMFGSSADDKEKYQFLYKRFPYLFKLFEGFDVNNTKNNDNKTPLLILIEEANIDALKEILYLNPNINIIDNYGNNIYDYIDAVYEVDSRKKIAKLIEEYKQKITINNRPQKLVKILTNFTADKPMKYTTHTWDFGTLKNEYTDFNGYLSKVQEQWDTIKGDLKELSPNLYKKVNSFYGKLIVKKLLLGRLFMGLKSGVMRARILLNSWLMTLHLAILLTLLKMRLRFAKRMTN